MKQIGITETVLRDANQSLIATRLPFERFAEILEEINKASYHSIECWGGATFDSCLRYLNEDPWERLRKIKAICKDTKLQMLLRGQNLLGYKPYSDDVVEKFIELSIKNGIDIIRIFDALNDPKNMKTAIAATKKYGAEAQGTICFTISPVHTLEKYVELAKELETLGCDSLCIKDMSGILGPKECYDLVSAIKAQVKLPLIVHTHCTTGIAPITLIKAVEAGADVVDTAISSLSGGTSQFATESMVYSLKQLGYDVKVDQDVIRNINEFFKGVKEEYLENGTLDPYVLGTDTDALTYQVPGGMLSNLVSQLKTQNAYDKLAEVLAEVPRVKADLGHPPLVTPMSQMTGVQAVNNVLLGERYKAVSNEVKSYIKGEYGKAPGEISQELLTLVLGDEKPDYTRNFDNNTFEKTKKELEGIAKCDEDVLSYIAFPVIAKNFFEKREEMLKNTVKYTIRKVD